MTWGWTPISVGTIATTVGVLVALYGAWQANKVSRSAQQTADAERLARLAADERREEDQRAEARRSQAELVAAWTTADRSVRADDGMPRIYYTLNVSNRSNLPITSVRVLLSPSQGEVEQLVMVSEFAIGPGEKFQQQTALYGTADLARVKAVWSLYFTDAAGRRWHRKADVLREPTEKEEDEDIRSDVSGFDPDDGGT